MSADIVNENNEPPKPMTASQHNAKLTGQIGLSQQDQWQTHSPYSVPMTNQLILAELREIKVLLRELLAK